MDPHSPQYNTFSPGGDEYDLFPVGAGVDSVLPTEIGEGAATRAESKRGTFPPEAGKNSAFPAGAAVNSVLPTGTAVNSAMHSDSEQIEVRIERDSSPRPAIMLGGSTRIIAPFMGTTPALLSAEIEAVSAQAIDLVEWRIDPLLAALESTSGRCAAIEETWEEAVSRTSLPVLATIRTTAEGGVAELSASEYAELVAPLTGPTDTVDVEIARTGTHSLVAHVHEAGAAIIASFHDFNETPPDDTPIALYAQMAEADADILKITCCVTTPGDALRVLVTQIGAHREHRHPIIGIGTREAGATTWIVGAPLFSTTTFAFVAVSSAPGQFTVEEARRGLGLVEERRTVKKRKSDEEGETVDKARGH